MADTVDPGTAPVTDKRTSPLGVMPKNIKIYAMVGLTVVIMGITMLGGTPKPANRAANDVQPVAQAPNSDRLSEFAKKLRGDLERQQSQAIETPSAIPREMAQLPVQASSSATQAPPDPIAEERKRREYDSLFASNVVVSRRTGSSQPVGSAQEASGRRAGATADRMPTLEETAAAVIRASGQAGQAFAGMVGSVLPPGVTPPTTASGAMPDTGYPVTPAGTRRTGPIDSTGPMHRVLEGTLIDAVLTNRLDGSSASPVNAMVTNPVYSFNGDHVLIPAGSRVLGETKPVQSQGETRLAVAFHRLLLPDGSTVSLDQFKGLAQRGDSGLKDQVNNHYLSTFGAAAAVGLVSGLGQAVGNLGSGGQGSQTVVIGAGAAQSTSQSTSQVMSHFLNRLPTITIREGTRLHVVLTSDIDMPAFDGRKGLR